MNILSQRCRTLNYAVTTPSSAAMPLEPDIPGVTHEFGECLLLLIGVERGDSTFARAAAKAIRRIARKTDTTWIVINGFSHLTRPGHECDTTTARTVLARIAEHLRDHDFAVHMMPFGWNKTWRMEVRDGEWEQRMTRFPPIHADRNDRARLEGVRAEHSSSESRALTSP